MRGQMKQNIFATAVAAVGVLAGLTGPAAADRSDLSDIDAGGLRALSFLSSSPSPRPISLRSSPFYTGFFGRRWLG